MQDEVNQEKSEENDVYGMKEEAHSTGKRLHIYNQTRG